MRSRRALIGVSLLVILALAAGTAHFLGRPPLSDQQKIYALVVQAQKAVENHNSTGLTRLLSRDYVDSYGTTRQQLVAMIVQWMHGGEEVVAVPEITDLQIRESFADMHVQVRLWEGREPVGPGAEYALAVRLRREGRTWKVIAADGWAAAQSDVMNDE